MLRIFVCFLLSLFLVCPVQAEPLTVGVSGSAPFVTPGEELDGLCVQIWKEAAAKLDLEYELVKYTNVAELLKALAAKEIDVAVGPISITAERAESVEFTQPYYRADLGILSQETSRNIWQTVKPFLSRSFLYGLLILLGVLTVVGSLVWAAERKANPDEFPSGAAGLGNGMWFAIVTMTTVGYGDRSPRTVAGRLLAAVWMLIATISFSTLTAGIATALTFATLTNTSISSPSQLSGRKVAVVSGTTGEAAAREFGAETVVRSTLLEAIDQLSTDKAEAVVFDYPALKYYLKTHDKLPLKLAESHFKEQDYGFAVQLPEKEFAHDLDLALLSLAESGRLVELETSWLEGSEGKE